MLRAGQDIGAAPQVGSGFIWCVPAPFLNCSHCFYDFIVYRFSPSEFAGQWCNEISVTVGRNSLLPVQLKIVLEPGNYDLYIFDYELDGGFERINNEMLPKLN